MIDRTGWTQPHCLLVMLKSCPDDDCDGKGDDDNTEDNSGDTDDFQYIASDKVLDYKIDLILNPFLPIFKSFS